MGLLLKNLFLTFCLIIAFAISKANAEDSSFQSKHLSSFYNKAVTVEAAKLNGVEYCKLYHKGVEFEEELVKKLSVFNVKSLAATSEEDIKLLLLNSEKNDTEFWTKNNVEIDETKLSTIEEIISSNVFNNLSGVVDNIYCFPYLGSRYENDEQRKLVVSSLSGIESEVKAFVYYDDGFETKTASVLIVYLLDPVKNEVYALKGIIK